MYSIITRTTILIKNVVEHRTVQLSIEAIINTSRPLSPASDFRNLLADRIVHISEVAFIPAANV